MTLKSLRSQRADRVEVGELGGWETVAREWGPGVCDFYGGVVLRDAKVCVRHGHRGLKWNGCGGLWSWRGQRANRPGC